MSSPRWLSVLLLGAVAGSGGCSAAPRTPRSLATVAIGVSPDEPPVARPAPPLPEGQLDRQLVETDVDAVIFLHEASKAETARLPVRLAPGERAFAGEMPREDALRLMLVESSQGRALYVAPAASTTFTAAQRHPLGSTPPPGALPYREGDEGVLLEEPVAAGGFVPFVPLHLLVSPEREAPFQRARRTRKKGGTEERVLFHGDFLAVGSLDLDGRSTRVGFRIEGGTGKVSGLDYFIDADGDGRIDTQSSTEHAPSRTENDPPVVSRVGSTFLAPAAVDPVSGRFRFERRRAAEYLFAEPRIGATLPDLAFVDLDGKPRRLSELRGKYVLLDAWATWCSPCRDELPVLRAAHERFHTRNLEIVGLNLDEDLEALQKFLGAQPLPWPQASAAVPATGIEVKRWIEQRLGIRALPAQILVDPDGKIAVLSTLPDPGHSLQGSGLAATLDELLPR